MRPMVQIVLMATERRGTTTPRRVPKLRNRVRMIRSATMGIRNLDVVEDDRAYLRGDERQAAEGELFGNRCGCRRCLHCTNDGDRVGPAAIWQMTSVAFPSLAMRLPL